MSEQPIRKIRIDPSAASRFFFWSNACLHGLITLLTFGIWSPVLLVWCLGLGQWYAATRARTFEAELTNKRIKIADGVFVRKIKSIPLDRVTDLVQNQGIVERALGIWSLHVQTAGAGGASVAEGIIFAVLEPEKIREEVVAARNDYVESM